MEHKKAVSHKLMLRYEIISAGISSFQASTQSRSSRANWGCGIDPSEVDRDCGSVIENNAESNLGCIINIACPDNPYSDSTNIGCWP